MINFPMKLAAAALLAWPLLTHAQVSSTGSLSNFSFTLIDLLPDDGIAPSLAIVPLAVYPGGSSARTDLSQQYTEEPWYSDNRTQSTTRYNRDLDLSLSKPAGSARVQTGGRDFQSLTLRTEAAATSRTNASRQVTAHALFTMNEFVLSPGTEVSFVADLHGELAATRPWDSNNQESAILGASVQLRASRGEEQFWYDTRQVNAYLPNRDDGASFDPGRSVDQRIAITFQNTTAYAANLGLEFSLSSTVYAIDATPAISPVPEPATTAMLAVGLAVAGGLARRRSATGNA